MRIVYGTGNPAKLASMREMLAGLPLVILGLNEMENVPGEPEEPGSNPMDNAVAKARAYRAALGLPVFSCDSGLYIEGLAPDEQPGTHVRNVSGVRLSDEGMIAHYAGIARSLGGTCVARYRNAICLALDEVTEHAYTGDDLHGSRFILTDKPHPIVRPGFPLDSLSIHMESGRYYNDMGSEHAYSNAKGFAGFFGRVLGFII